MVKAANMLDTSPTKNPTIQKMDSATKKELDVSAQLLDFKWWAILVSNQ
jgi:hypothetical protein